MPPDPQTPPQPQKPDPKPKPLSERIYYTHHTRNRQTFSNQQRLEVLAYLKNHVVYAPTMAPSKRGDWRPATIPEAAAFFSISHHTIRSWRRQQDKILAEAGLSTSELPPTLTAETRTLGEDTPSVPETARSSEAPARSLEATVQRAETATTQSSEATAAQIPMATAVQSYALTTAPTPSPNPIPQRKRRGPMPKPLSEREPKRLKPVTQIQRTYNNRQRIEVLAYLQNHIVYAPTMGPAQRGDWRPPTIGEAAEFFKISANTIKSWRKQQDKILAKAGISTLEPSPSLTTEPQPGNRDMPPVSEAAQSSEATTAQNSETTTAQNSEATTAQNSEATTAQNSATTASQSHELTATPTPAPQRKRRGPKPKPLSERKPKRLTPVTQIQRTYNNRQRLQVLAYLENHIVYAPTMGPAQRGDWRPPTIGEAADFFKISANTIKTWRKRQNKILAKAGIPTLKAKPQPVPVAETAGTSETATETTGQNSETTGQNSETTGQNSETTEQNSETTGQTFETTGQSSQTTTTQSSATEAAQVSETKTITATP
ncbi:hypothetical protein E4U56_008245 [Claviceps arundinis]|uniref:Uncharacterized protein n=1 Tax=Claviceps arundinis TaxID=1623583 RepID=A0A9P7SPM8_9HYPO|nr:hypothetical protein E4U56_008245 [Claviceps arundinis]